MCIFSKPKVDNSASIYYQQQQEAERKRQQGISDSVTAINSYFGDGTRDDIYNNVYDAAHDNYMFDVNDQYENALAKLKVNLARNSQSGASLDASKTGNLREAYDKAVIQAQQRAEQMKRNLIAQDNSVRSSLIQQAYGGLGATDAQQIALSSLNANAQNFLNNAANDSLGDLFSSYANSVNTGYANAGRNAAGNQYKDEYTTYFTPSGSYAGAVS